MEVMYPSSVANRGQRVHAIRRKNDYNRERERESNEKHKRGMVVVVDLYTIND